MTDSDEDYSTTTLDMCWNLLLSSEIDDDNGYFQQRLPGSHFVPVDSLVSYLSSPTLRSHVDIVEVFGGMGGVSRIAIRRRIVCG